MFVATLNKTLKSYLFAIIGAEYILRWLPIGTHEWEKFVKPEDLIDITKKYDLSLESNENNKEEETELSDGAKVTLERIKKGEVFNL